jgi:hypothetical protein
MVTQRNARSFQWLLGVAVVPLIVSWISAPSHNWLSCAISLVSIVAYYIIGSFCIWREERKKAVELQRRLDETTIPRLSAYIEKVIASPTTGVILAYVVITNDGAATTSGDWEMRAVIDGKEEIGELISEEVQVLKIWTEPDKYGSPQSRNKSYDREKELPIVTKERRISHGDRIDGAIMAKFPKFSSIEKVDIYFTDHRRLSPPIKANEYALAIEDGELACYPPVPRGPRIPSKALSF